MGVFSKKNLAKIQAEEQKAKKHRILVVDDEPDNRVTLANILNEDYHVVTAGDGQEALELIQTDDDIHLIICDQRMPRMTGVSFLEKSIEIIPDAKRMILSGYADVEAVIAAVNRAKIYEFMLKPVDHQKLRLTVKRALEAFDLERNNLEMLDRLRELNRTLEKKVAERTRDLELRNEEILRTQQQMVTQEKMASLGTLTAGVAHELKNPLNFINNFSDISVELFAELRHRLEHPSESQSSWEDVGHLMSDLQVNVETIQKHGRMAVQIIKSMMDFAHGGTAQPTPTDLNDLIDEYVNLAYIGQKGKSRVTINKEFDRTIQPMRLIPQKLGRVWINLINNAVEACLDKESKAPPEYRPVIDLKTSKEGDRAVVVLRDNGKGIPNEKIKQIFNAFFTTKPAGTGNAGLGLAICYDIVVREHGGEIQVSSEEGHYTQFTISFPLDA